MTLFWALRTQEWKRQTKSLLRWKIQANSETVGLHGKIRSIAGAFHMLLTMAFEKGTERIGHTHTHTPVQEAVTTPPDHRWIYLVLQPSPDTLLGHREQMALHRGIDDNLEDQNLKRLKFPKSESWKFQNPKCGNPEIPNRKNHRSQIGRLCSKKVNFGEGI